MSAIGTRARLRRFGSVWVACALLLPAGGIAVADDQSTDLSRCVSFDQETDAHGIDLRLHSACEAALRCELRWRVICDGEARARERARFTLAPGEREDRRARADECEETWKVTDVAWECHTREE